MAQDFGDDMGEMLLRAAGRTVARELHDYIREHTHDWYRQQYEKEGLPAQDASIKAEMMASREQICLPFGSGNDAAYFAQVCRENGFFVAALTDAEGSGYIQFAKDDLEGIRGCTAQFAEVMTAVESRAIAARLSQAAPVTEEVYAGLSEIRQLPSLPETSDGRAPIGIDAPSGPLPQNHTESIRDAVADARAECRDFADFERLLSQKGIGVTTTTAGEVMFYEARRRPDGTLLPFGTDAQGHRDWAVGADTLKKKWGVDATHDWFASNRPLDAARSLEIPKDIIQQVADGSLDTDGATPDLNQGIASHDGMDTESRTLRIEREGNGTDVPPSKVRAEAVKSRRTGQDYSLQSVSAEARAASKQLAKESGVAAHELGISDKLSPIR